MGEVYRARDDRLGRDVAVKVLPEAFASDPERLRRFEQEARAAGALNHPNVLSIYDLGTHEGAPYVVSELLEGETLGTRLKAGALPIRKVIDFAIHIARGLTAAHEKGIVHRDLKPDNLFLSKDGTLKILDFGLAKLIRPEGVPGKQDDTLSVSLTETGAILGTAGYMSPEQLRGERADARADLFAFGAILYEMLGGRRAFPGTTTIDSMYAILNTEPVPLGEVRPEVPASLETLVRHCLEKNPLARFQSARDAAITLEAFSAAPGTVTAASASVRRALFAGRSLVVATIVALLVSGVLGALLHQRFSKLPTPTFKRLTFRRGLVSGARFGPDGHSVIYSAAWQGKPLEMFSVSIDRPDSRDLGFVGSEVLSVSKNGEMAMRLPSGTLARAPLAGGAPREILERAGDADWSPDGEHLAVIRSPLGTGQAERGVNTTEKRVLEYPLGTVLYSSPTFISRPRVSRDGSRVAFIDHTVPGDLGGSVAVVDRRGRKRTLTPWWVDIEGIAWAHRGDEIWFTASPTGAGQPSLLAVSPNGRLRVVFATPGGLTLKDIAPDGRALLARLDLRTEVHGRSA
ncbi:MAG: protein kinase, partial [Candidatus Eisenbacteria bacterium]